jgi:hypothetical protein
VRQRLLSLLPALLLVPFVGKALHVDDRAFLDYAHAIARGPLHPFAQTVVFEGHRISLFDQPNPLVWPYCIAAWTALFGESEIALHALTLVFALIALWAFADLAARLELPQPLACLLLASSSAFLVMGSSVMPDVPLLALVLLAAALIVRESPWAGVACAAAFLCRYTGAVTLGLALAYPLLQRKRDWRRYLPFAVGALLAFVFGWDHLQHTLAQWSAHLDGVRLRKFGTASLAHLGAQLPWPYLSLVAAGPLLAALSAIVAFALGVSQGYLVAFVFALPGIAALLDALYRIGDTLSHLRRRDGSRRGCPHFAVRMLLALWLLGTAFSTVRYVHVAAKYILLPLAPALLLLLDRLRDQKRLVRASVPITAALGLLVAVSDYRFAGMYRDFFAGEWQALKGSGTNYVAAEWGFQYYAEKAGLTPYAGEPLKPADRVFTSMIVAHPTRPGPDVATIDAARAVSYAGPFAILSFDDRAGFYSNFWGPYPFVPALQVTDTILVLRPRP